jgi:hypothetical protein
MYEEKKTRGKKRRQKKEKKRVEKKEGEKEEKKGPQEREYNTKTPCQKLKRGKKTCKLTETQGHTHE